MLKILNLWPIKIISVTINHLTSNSSTIFLIQLSNKSKRKAKVTDLPDGNRTIIDLIRELENEKVDFRFPYRSKLEKSRNCTASGTGDPIAEYGKANRRAAEYRTAEYRRVE